MCLRCCRWRRLAVACAAVTSPVTVTSLASIPATSGAVPLPFNNESASAKPSSTWPSVVSDVAPSTSGAPAASPRR